MCTCYYLEPSSELIPIIERTKRCRLTRDMIIRLGRPLKKEGLISPEDMVPVIAPDRTGNRKEFPMIWGFHVDGLEKPVITARVENARTSATFQESWKRHRCVIPAAYYFEWSRIQSGGRIVPKDQYVIQPTGKTATYFAGLYRIETGSMGFKYPAFLILTRPATNDLKEIDTRMPVMLDEKDINTWIRPDKIPNKIRSATDMVAEKFN